MSRIVPVGHFEIDWIRRLCRELINIVPSVTQFDLKDIQLPGSLEAEVRRGRTLSNIWDQFERRVEQVSAEANIREVLPIFCIYDQGHVSSRVVLRGRHPVNTSENGSDAKSHLL